MKLSKSQLYVSKDSHRFRVCISGRRWGKTYLAINELAKYARIPDRDVYYVAPSYRQAKNIVWKKLKYALMDLNWVKKIYENELMIILRNDSTISLKGADNYDSLRGAGLDFVVLDEFADIDPAAWYEVLRPALSDKNGHALFVGTPKGKSNWSYDIFNNHDKEEWSSFQFTTLDGGNVTAQEIESAKLDLDIRTFNQEYMATFETYGSTIAYNFDRDNHVKIFDNIDDRLLYVGMDFNNSPITASISIKINDILYQIDEVYMNDSNTVELCQEIKNRYPNSQINTYPDPAGNQRKTSANRQTDFTIISNFGFKIFAPSAHNAVRDRINATNSLLKNVNGQIRYYVHPKCKYTIESLEKYTYKDGTQIPDKQSGFDHMFDALSYKIDYLYPLKRDIKNTQPRRFGHQLA